MLNALGLGRGTLAAQRLLVQRGNLLSVKAVPAANDGDVALDHCASMGGRSESGDKRRPGVSPARLHV